MKNKYLKIALFLFVALIIFIGGLITGGRLILNMIENEMPRKAHSFRIYSSSGKADRNINSDTAYIDIYWAYARLKDSEFLELKKNIHNEDDVKFLLSILNESDILYKFETPLYTWMNLAGRSGIVLIRRGKPIYGIVTKLN